MKALVGAFNQEKAQIGAFSVIVQLHRLIVDAGPKELLTGTIKLFRLSRWLAGVRGHWHWRGHEKCTLIRRSVV